jgi:hypothetical protein
VEAGDFKAIRPGGIAYDPTREEFLVAAEGAGSSLLYRLDSLWDQVGVVEIPTMDAPSSLTYDVGLDRLSWIQDGRFVGVDASLIRSSARITQLDSVLQPHSSIPAGDSFAPGDADLLTAAHPSDGLLYVLDVDLRRVAAIDERGQLVTSYETSSVDLVAPQTMIFAPSTDTTDDPAALNLFVADSGDESWDGGITEVTLQQTELMIAAEVISASLTQTINTSAWSPPSTDPSGIVWNQASDQLIVVDSEINEIAALFEDVNMWHINRAGVVLSTGATFGPNSAGSYSDEPTGLGYDNASGTLFVSDDTGTRSVYVVKTGDDGQFGTLDDVVVAIDVGVLGLADTEDPAFDPVTGHLFVLSGVDREVLRIDPVDGIFGNGNDLVTSFDLSTLGTDFEGMTSSVSRGTLYVGSRNTKQIFELTKDGQLVRTIDLSTILGLQSVSGLAIAPSTVDPSVMSLWVVDRGVDEMPDGKIFEIAVPDLAEPMSNLPPLVDAGANQSVVYPAAANLAGSASDDGEPEGSVLAHSWTAVSGPGVVTFGDPTALVTTASFSQIGVYVLRLTATDGQFTSSDSVLVTVAAPPNNTPPTIDPIADVTVVEGASGVVDVSVFDADGDDLTITTDDLPAFASFDPGTGQITISPQLGDAGSYGPVAVTVSDFDGDVQPPTLRSASSAGVVNANASTLTIARPAGVEPGDVLIAQIRYRDSAAGGANLTAPPGWSTIATIADGQANHSVVVKVAGESEPTQYTFDQNSATGRLSGGIGAYVGVDPTEPIHAWAASAARTGTLIAPSVTTAIDDTTVLRLWGWRGPDSAADNTAPAGISQRWSEQQGFGTSLDRNMVLAGDHAQTVAGATDVAVASGSLSVDENRRSGFTVVLAPAAVGASVSTTFMITVDPADPTPGGGGGGGGGPVTEVGGIVIERPCLTGVPSSGFTDVAPGSVHAGDIDCVAHVGIAAGVGDGRYDPAGVVTRWQMALFLTRTAELLGIDVPVATPAFADLDGLDAEARAAIGSLAAMGLTTGTSATEYSPAAPVTRWQMALFLTRLYALTGSPLPAGDFGGFEDLAGLDEGTISAINRLAELGITTGATPTGYDPFNPVSREQMASFLARLIKLDELAQ